MAATKVLSRLLRLRQLEEEQSRLELESAVRKRNRVSQQLDSIRELQQQGRERFASAVHQANAAQRIGATLELELTSNQRAHTEGLLIASESEVERQRAEFLERRTSRRQVETLVEQKTAVAREESNRRAQQMLDDWYGRKLPRASAARRQEPAKKSARE